MDRVLGTYISSRLYRRHNDPKNPAKYHHNEIYGWTNLNNPKRREGDPCKECMKSTQAPYKETKNTELVNSTDPAKSQSLSHHWWPGAVPRVATLYQGEML